MQMIPSGTGVVRGDSASPHQAEVLAELKERNQNKLNNPLVRDAGDFHALGREERIQ